MVEVADCQVCKAEPAVGVGASSLGPMSLPIGLTCLKEHAEAEMLVDALYDMTDGMRGANMAALEGLKTYKDGRYWTLEEWTTWRQSQPEPAYG